MTGLRWDDDLGRELRESPVPAHAPDHFERIRRRVRELTGEDGRPPAPPVRFRARRVPPPPPRRNRGVRFAAVAVAAAAVAVAVAVTWAGVPGIRQATPSPATADTVLASVQHALTHLGTISGDVVEYGSARGRPFSHRIGSFTLTSRGDYRIVQSARTRPTPTTPRSAWRDAMSSANGKALYSEVARDLPDPGPFFSPWMGASQVLDRSVAAYARAVIAELDPDVPVTPVTWEGRTAWSITVPEPLAGGGSDGTARIVVDAQSGYPLAVEHWTSDGEVSGTRIENVRVGRDVPRSRFTLAGHVQDKLLPMSERFRRMTLPQAAALGHRATTSFTPYSAAWVPRGYRLSGVTGAVNGAFMGAYQPLPRRRGRLAHRRAHLPSRVRPLLHRQPLAQRQPARLRRPVRRGLRGAQRIHPRPAHLRAACAARRPASSSAFPTGRTSTSAPASTTRSRSASPAISRGTSWRASPAPSIP